MVGLAALLPITASSGKMPLRHLADAIGIFSGSVSFPMLSSPPLKKRIDSVTRPPDHQAVKGKVAVFPGCVFEFFQAHIGEDMVNALADAGYEVVYKEDLCCCGQAVHSSGDFKTALMMAQKNIDALDSFDTVITGCATCSSAMKAYGRWFEGDDQWRNRAVRFSEKVRDFSEFLSKKDEQPGNKTDQTRETLTVTYHDPCHLRQHQGVFEAPRKILRSLPGVRFVEMENADACCGLGGSFGISHGDISFAIQEKKINSIKKTGADAVVTSCPGCLMFLAHGIRRFKLPVKVMHIAELVASHRNTGKNS
jgi:glycolate oxidase iron-sulfur subunit